jgi:hypothetical protein
VSVYVATIEVDGLVVVTVEAADADEAARTARRRAETGEHDSANLTYECVRCEQVKP